ncbi:class D sortase [uncultured Metabacillus sp.]|uniref:class D sortase n=1 Tax=uncultured Metabacillus sp. TaxID=2860135 RepID=UPI0026195DE2|nr:class D sortase [uncultured Metabacillus sp.]
MRSTNDVTSEKTYMVSPNNGEPFQPVAVPTPKEGAMIGTLSIPKLEQTVSIFHGSNETILRKGIGHVKGTALPGEASNSVLAGHRDTFFRKLEQLEQGDKLIVHRSEAKYLYKINKIRIVDKDDRTVIVPKPRSTLTLTTCYPFTFIGPAPQRYIIEAELIKKPQKGNHSHKNSKFVSGPRSN